MKKIVSVIGLLAVMATSAYAVESAGSTKTLSIIQFSEAPENRGIHGRLLERRYQEYRNGRFAVTTLDTAHLR